MVISAAPHAFTSAPIVAYGGRIPGTNESQPMTGPDPRDVAGREAPGTNVA
jgi:hypothetical protein